LAGGKVASFSLAGSDTANFDAHGFDTGSNGDLFVAIADGVGSAKFGGEAAKLAIAAALELAWTADVAGLFEAISQRIKAAATGSERDWSTTLTACWIRSGVAEVGHVGDTRLYHIRGSGLMTRTKDQTEVARLIEEGILSPERALRYPRRNVLLSSLNGSGNYELYREEFTVQAADKMLLISDGVYKRLSKREILATATQVQDAQGFADGLKSLLTSKGIEDDATAVCVSLD